MKTVEEKMTAWIDGTLTGSELAEFEKELGREQIISEKEAAQQIGALLRTHSRGPELKNADFFNHQLMQRIKADQAAGMSSKRGAAFQIGSLFLSLSRMAWAGAACLLIALVLFATMIPGARRSNPTPGQYMAEILNAHTDDPTITASAFHSKAGNVTVLWLDGLNYLPDGDKL